MIGDGCLAKSDAGDETGTVPPIVQGYGRTTASGNDTDNRQAKTAALDAVPWRTKESFKNAVEERVRDPGSRVTDFHSDGFG